MIAVDTAGTATIEDLALVHALPELTLADRCDRCHVAAAQVSVRLRRGGGRLSLCGHHWQAARGVLEPLCDAVRWVEGATHEGREPRA